MPAIDAVHAGRGNRELEPHLSTKNGGVDLMDGTMGMGGWMMLWAVIGVLLVIFLIVAIVKMAQKK